MNNFYKLFEERFRGPREEIKIRLEVHLPFVKKLNVLSGETTILDIGCGRGEWLELLKENGFDAMGVDIDEGMLQDCFIRGLSAVQKDALDFLKSYSDETVSLITGFHIVEHLNKGYLLEIFRECFRVLRPGGILIFETPNPENIKVATSNFYLDPTHLNPIPPDLLKFLAEYTGFCRTNILRLQEKLDVNKVSGVTLSDVLEGVSPDYSIVSQKSASEDLLDNFKELFDIKKGIKIYELYDKFQERISKSENQISMVYDLDKKQEELSSQLQQIESNLNKKCRELDAVCSSYSWKITKPLRKIWGFFRK